MTTKAIATRQVSLGRIFLNLENPRHEPVTTEANAIERLCTKEDVPALARDIVRYGTNPLELVGLVPVDAQKTDQSNPSYFVAEGNRRVCALKLLNDPELAPANLRKAFEGLAKNWSPAKTINSAIFPSLKEARLWMGRIHNGPQGGIGRKDWDSEQKTRFDGSSKNKIAQSLLDYAEQLKMLNAAERSRKLTTAQRFLGNDVFRETLGVDSTDPDNLGRTRPKSEFDTILRRFVRDLADGQQVHSRMNKSAIISYARGLNGLAGVTAARIEPEPLSVETRVEKTKIVRPKSPQKPEKAIHIHFYEEVEKALRTLGNEKLESLYYSTCSIELERHTPIVCVGVWSFFETLTACAGRNEGTSFDSFLSKSKLTNYGITRDVQALRSAMSRIREYGNTTKHHPVAATFNGDQLNNDMSILKDVILKCVADAIEQST
jgi:hypothetical protein